MKMIFGLRLLAAASVSGLPAIADRDPFVTRPAPVALRNDRLDILFNIVCSLMMFLRAIMTGGHDITIACNFKDSCYLCQFLHGFAVGGIMFCGFDRFERVVT